MDTDQYRMTLTLKMQTKQSKKHDAAAAFQHILTLPSSAAAQAAQKEKRIYKCGHCSTTFRRSEHCVRHERSREFFSFGQGGGPVCSVN